MRTLGWSLVILIAMVAAPAQAQTLPGDPLDRLRRSFHGCDTFGSCITVTVDLTQHPEARQFYEGTVSWRARFAKPAWIYRFTWPEIAYSSYYEFGGGLFSPTRFETGSVWESFHAAYDNPPGSSWYWIPFRPTLIDGIIQYPEPGGVYGDPTHDVAVGLTVTPEPTSLLLLVTGLAGVAAQARRRRRLAAAARRITPAETT